MSQLQLYCTVDEKKIEVSLERIYAMRILLHHCLSILSKFPNYWMQTCLDMKV